MAETTNYKLYVVDEGTEKFIDWRLKLAGTAESNMVKIDEALKDLADAINNCAVKSESGVVPIESGGTNANNAADALDELGAMWRKTPVLKVTSDITLSEENAERLLICTDNCASVVLPGGMPVGTVVTVAAVDVDVVFAAGSGATIVSQDSMTTLEAGGAATVCYAETGKWYIWGALA